ncbi:MAG: Ig-like domain-containing protein, partial [Terrimicrobiaceae bacterium]
KTYVFELYTGRLLQTIPFGGIPSLAGGRLYLAGADGMLRTYGRPNPSNVAPVATPGSVIIDEDTSTVIQLQGSDSNSDPIKAVICKLPVGGTLYQTTDGVNPGAAIAKAPATVTNPDHKVLYRPAMNANGAGYGTFEFLMSDAYTYSPAVQYIVNVTPLNDTPVANDDTAATQPDQLLSPIRVLNNDVDVDGDSLTIVSFTQGASGDVKLNSDGSFSYLPHSGVTEVKDKFSYVIRDPSGLTSQATVRVSISTTSGADWPTFGGGPDHAGYVPVNFGTGAWTPGWSYTIGGRSLQQVAVADGMVVLAPTTRFTETFILGLSASSGTQRWRHDFAQANSLCPPSVFGGDVYVQRANAGDTQLWCLNAANGTTIWSSPFGAQWESYFAPAVTADGVWIDGGTYGGLYGFDHSGGQKFFASLPQYDLWTPSIGPDGTLYTWVAGIFTAHLPATGVKLWSVNAGWDWHGWSMNTTTAISDGKAFAIGSPGLFAVDLNSHTIIWNNASSFTGSPAAAGGVVYAISGNSVKAYNAGSGVLLTTYSTGDSASLINQPI